MQGRCRVPAPVHGSSDNRGAPVALDRPDLGFDEDGRGVMQVALLCKELDLWQRINTLEKTTCEARRGDGPPTDEAPHYAAIAADYAPVGRALVFVATWELAAGHLHFRPHRAGEEPAALAAAKARDAAGPGPSPEFPVPSDSDLGLRPGVARKCVSAFIAMARGHHIVAAARSGLLPASPDEVNAPGGGVAEIFSPVRAQVREALLCAREVEDRGFQQRFSTPAKVYRR